MSVISAANHKVQDILSIAQEDGVSPTKPNCEKEWIEDETYNEFKYQSLYPIHPKFKQFYELWSRHQSCFWSIHENNPSVDRDKFQKAPKQLQSIVLHMIGCITIGDDIVLKHIADNLLTKITVQHLKAMMVDQSSREHTHKFMYSRMLDVASDPQYFRNEEFKIKFMDRFEKIALKYTSDDIRVQFYFIMLCENILFAPMFQTICYLATLGYAPKLCDSNLLVMRDEFIHYENARYTQASFKNKIDIKFANELLDVFHQEINILCQEIIGDYDDETYNLKNVQHHLSHVVHGFRVENSLYEDLDQFKRAQSKYSTSPALKYMELPRCELRNNLMESSSTIYMVNGNNEPINMDFDF